MAVQDVGIAIIKTALQKLSVVIPARDEEGCIASTVEHLHLELRMQGVPHEIVVVDDGSTDATWRLLNETARRIPELVPVQHPGPPAGVEFRSFQMSEWWRLRYSHQ